MSNHVLYSETVVLDANGRFQKGSVGGSPSVRDPADGLFQTVGYKLPPVNGSLQCVALAPGDALAAAQCLMHLEGYNGRVIDGLKVPGTAVIELPCSIRIEGPPGTSLALTCRITSGIGSDRGGVQSVYRSEVDVVSQIPLWARSVDWSPAALGSGALLTFRDVAAATVGVVPALITGFSIPTGAVDCNLTGGASTLVYRQN